jgi:hypothetical protein
MDIDKFDHMLNQLYKFSPEMLGLGEPIVDDRLEAFEKVISYMLPDDFMYIMKKHNGFSLDGTEVYGIDEGLRGSSLDIVYKFEHFEVADEMPVFFLPFSPDGRGNHYCLDLSRLKNGYCPVVFWQWGFPYESLNEVETCHENFLDWIQEAMINWASE